MFPPTTCPSPSAVLHARTSYAPCTPLFFFTPCLRYSLEVNSQSFLGEFQHIDPADVILVEGMLLLYFSEIRNLLDLKVFADMDCDTRLSRRVSRDVALVCITAHTLLCSSPCFIILPGMHNPARSESSSTTPLFPQSSQYTVSRAVIWMTF